MLYSTHGSSKHHPFYDLDVCDVKQLAHTVMVAGADHVISKIQIISSLGR